MCLRPHRLRARRLGHFEPADHRAPCVLRVVDPKLPIGIAPWNRAADGLFAREEMHWTWTKLFSHEERERATELEIERRDLRSRLARTPRHLERCDAGLAARSDRSETRSDDRVDAKRA